MPSLRAEAGPELEACIKIIISKCDCALKDSTTLSVGSVFESATMYIRTKGR
jgi:hypothetical protein